MLYSAKRKQTKTGKEISAKRKAERTANNSNSLDILKEKNIKLEEKIKIQYDAIEVLNDCINKNEEFIKGLKDEIEGKNKSLSDLQEKNDKMAERLSSIESLNRSSKSGSNKKGKR